MIMFDIFGFFFGGEAGVVQFIFWLSRAFRSVGLGFLSV